MFQAFVIMLREGFEAFLIVSIIVSYLRKIRQETLLPAAYWGIMVSIFASTLMGFLLSRGVNEPLWEGILGIVAAVMVTSLVIHMWKHGPHMKKEMETELGEISITGVSPHTPQRPFGGERTRQAWWGVFFFTVFMITREGMETALMLIQVPQGSIFAGVLLGLAATSVYCYLWVRFSHLINVRLFFQVTGIFLLLFVVQILIYSVHEFSETGLIPNSEGFHNATEPFSPSGIYGRWFSVVTVAVCAAWLLIAWLKDRLKRTSA